MRDNMDELKDKSAFDANVSGPAHVAGIPQKAVEQHVKKTVNTEKSGSSGGDSGEEFSLNDDRRVKVLSPGALVVKRFFRNRLAVVGLIMLIVMFVFSFIGGLLNPYGQAEQFYTYSSMKKEYVGVTKNDSYRYLIPEGKEFGAAAQAQFVLALTDSKDAFSYKGTDYSVADEGKDLWGIYSNGEMTAVVYKDIVMPADGEAEQSFEFKYNALKAYTGAGESFTSEGITYTLDEEGNISDGTKILAYISRFVVQSKVPGVDITRDFKEKLAETLENDENEFKYSDENGDEFVYTLEYDAMQKVWSVIQAKDTYVYDKYSSPSLGHLLGTDVNGMDVMTRLMYGGRVSLVIGFIVVIIETVLGVIMGGISGYFGGFVDNLIMRIVDVFYCIPSMPIIIIIGAAMDHMQLDPQLRMLYLMLILGFLGWPGIARLVRGQILSLREQEFMTAAEASGISSFHRIFRHLIPNVIPQLIVSCTMGLGSVILTEATLSFLGLGVKFPFASWGNIISDVNNSFVMTNYWFVWIPAGICLLVTVLGFNFVGDGLRDAFDPKMKR